MEGEEWRIEEGNNRGRKGQGEWGDRERKGQRKGGKRTKEEGKDRESKEEWSNGGRRGWS